MQKIINSRFVTCWFLARSSFQCNNMTLYIQGTLSRHLDNWPNISGMHCHSNYPISALHGGGGSTQKIYIVYMHHHYLPIILCQHDWLTQLAIDNGPNAIEVHILHLLWHQESPWPWKAILLTSIQLFFQVTWVYRF